MSRELTQQLDRIFHPRAVAVIGATDRVGNFGRMFTQGYISMGRERLYPVNPRAESVLGLTAYASLRDVPDTVDLAHIVVPKEALLPTIEECADYGVAGAIIFTAGYGEQGEAGRAEQAALVAAARRNGMRLIGPNCMGIYCPASRLTINAGMPVESGGIGMISHSGSLTAFLSRAATTRGMRFSAAVSCGNQCDLNAADFLEYFGDDPQTEIVIGYIESVPDGRRLLELARRIAPRKPILFWKGGITERGARAAASHTGALAGSAALWRTLCAQAGIVSAASGEELIDTLQAFYYCRRLAGRGVAVVSGPGGPAVACTDACIEAGLNIAELSDATVAAIAAVLPSVGTSSINPIDMGMASGRNPQWYRQVIAVLGRDPAVDVTLIMGGGSRVVSQSIVDGVQASGKPAAIIIQEAMMTTPEERQFVLDHGLPVYPDGRRAALALGRLAIWSELHRSIGA